MREEHISPNYIKKISASLRVIVFLIFQASGKTLTFMDFLFAKECRVSLVVIHFAKDISSP